MTDPAPPTPEELAVWKRLTAAFSLIALVAIGVAVYSVIQIRRANNVALDEGTPAATAPTVEATATSTPEATATPEPTTTATATPEPTASATPAPTATATATPEPTATASAEPPARLVAITTDGRLVLLDAATGEELRELDVAGSPSATSSEGPPPNYLDSVALAPDGRIAYYDDCCEPVSGNLYAILTGGGTRAGAGYYYAPAVSPDGSTLAVLDVAVGIALLDAATYERVGEIPDPGYEGSLRAPAWSPDGSQVAWERLSEGGDQIAVADAADGATAHEVPQPEGPGWQLPAWRADGLLVVAAQCCGGFSEPAATEPGEAAVVDPADGEVVATFPHPGFVVDQDLDPSGRWLLVTYDDGAVVAIDPDGGQRTIGTGFRAASW